MQKIALYDRFGRLILGTEHEAKPVLEYVVFENHIASFDGAWRLHDKVYPEWIKPKQDLPKLAFMCICRQLDYCYACRAELFFSLHELKVIEIICRQTRMSQEHLRVQTRQPLKLGGGRELSVPEEK